jgi:hypothetical protein
VRLTPEPKRIAIGLITRKWKTQFGHGKILPVRERRVQRRPSGFRLFFSSQSAILKCGVARIENIAIGGGFAATFTSSFPAMPNPHLRFPILRRVIVGEDALSPGLNDHKLGPGSSLLEDMSLAQSFLTA